VPLRILFVFPVIALCASAALFILPHTSEAALTDGLVGYWTFDGYDLSDKVYDRVGGNNGYFTGGATSSAKVQGKLGQALNFDGTDDSVRMPNTSGVADNLTNMTVAAWVKMTTNQDGEIISKDPNSTSGWGLSTNSSGRLSFYTATNGSNYHGRIVGAGTLINDGLWHHVAVTLSGGGSGTITIYIDGVSQPLNADDLGTVTTYTSSANIWIGDVFFTRPFAGPIDDVRIYNRALSAAEVKQLYLKGNALTKPPNNLGLVGYWPFNEGTGIKATDFSGNGNTGTRITMAGNLPAWTNGKRGAALDFDNTVGNYVDIGNQPALFFSGSFTLSAWVKSESATPGFGQPIISDYNSAADASSFDLEITSGEEFCFFWENPTATLPQVCSSAKVSYGRWYHVVATWNGTTRTLYLNGVSDGTPNSTAQARADVGGNSAIGRLGSFDGHYFNGIIDDVRVYNRALSASEVAALYAGGTAGASQIGASTQTLQKGTSLANGLVGLWTFDGYDITQNAILDRSGQGNNGGFYNGATSSAKTQGKLGQALSFDGIDDYVQSANLSFSTPFSASMWVKLGQLVPVSTTYTFFNVNNCNFAFDEDELLEWWNNGAAGNGIFGSAIAPGVWRHLVFVHTGSTVSAYVDGAQYGSPLSSGLDSGCTGSRAVQIGGNTVADDYFKGSVDDVRIYNRALTADEVKQLYKLGTVLITQ
jgi:hypothetical protein